ncbi:hypothetical protein FOZ63_009017, partial [Perkinsus olseni]
IKIIVKDTSYVGLSLSKSRDELVNLETSSRSRGLDPSTFTLSSSLSANTANTGTITQGTRGFPVESPIALADEYSVKKQQDWQDLAEKALLGCIKIIAEIRRAGDLKAYAKHPKLIPKFSLTYQVDVGIALHSGWSVEGAIGSEMKIDATYIGFNVSVARSLVRALPLYGCSLLLTGDLMEHLGGKVRDRCRLIDERMVGEVGREPRKE